MEDIPEEEININDDMEIKDQNHAQVHQNAEQASTATPQSIQNKQLEEKKQETKTEIRSSDFCTQVTNISIEPNKRESTVGRQDHYMSDGSYFNPQEHPDLHAAESHKATTTEIYDDQDEEEDKDKKLNETIHLFQNLNDAKDIKLK